MQTFRIPDLTIGKRNDIYIHFGKILKYYILSLNVFKKSPQRKKIQIACIHQALLAVQFMLVTCHIFMFFLIHADIV